MKRKAYEEAGLSVAQQPPSRLWVTAADTKLGPANTQNSQVIATAPETMHLKTENSAGSVLFFVNFIFVNEMFSYVSFVFVCFCTYQ